MKQWRYNAAALLFVIAAAACLVWVVSWIPLFCHTAARWIGWVNFLSPWVTILAFFLAFVICDPVAADKDRIKRQ